MDDKQAPHRSDSVTAYRPPAIETVLTAQDLEREMEHAGAPQPASPNM